MVNYQHRQSNIADVFTKKRPSHLRRLRGAIPCQTGATHPNHRRSRVARKEESSPASASVRHSRFCANRKHVTRPDKLARPPAGRGVGVTFVGGCLHTGCWISFRPTAWENLAQGEPLRRNPGFTIVIPSSLKDCEPRVGNDCCQPFRLKNFFRYYPGRRRSGSPWAKVCQAFSLKRKNARTVNKKSTNFRDAYPSFAPPN